MQFINKSDEIIYECRIYFDNISSNYSVIINLELKI